MTYKSERRGSVKEDAPKGHHLIKTRVVRAKLGNKSELWLRDAWTSGKFPKPIPLGRDLVWDQAEVDAWIAAQLATRAA